MTPKQIRKAAFEAMTANFKSAIVNQATLTQALDEASEALSKYPKGEMGLTPDHVKATPQWQSDKRAFENAMKTLREFNSVMLRKYKKEYRQHMADERAARKFDGKCKTCVHHNATKWNDGLSQSWCDVHKKATDVRDGCGKHSSIS